MPFRPRFKFRVASWGLLFLWTGLVLSANVVLAVNTWRQFNSVGFARTNGRMAQSGLGQGALGRRGLRLRYTYSVDGVKYTGSRYRYDDDNISLRYDRVLGEFPPHSAHVVYYNPADPRDAVLSVGVDGADFLLLLVLMPFNVATFMFASAFWRDGRKANEFAGSFGAPVRRLPDGFRVCLAPVAPAEAGLCAFALATAAAASFVIARWGFHESTVLMEIIWALTIAAGLAGVLWRRMRNASGAWDFRFDNAGTLYLPGAAGENSSRRLPHSEALGVVALRRANSIRGGTYHTYLPAVTLRHGSAPLVRWGWHEERAVAFGRWLASELNLPFLGVQDEAAAASPPVPALS